MYTGTQLKQIQPRLLYRNCFNQLIFSGCAILLKQKCNSSHPTKRQKILVGDFSLKSGIDLFTHGKQKKKFRNITALLLSPILRQSSNSWISLWQSVVLGFNVLEGVLCFFVFGPI